ncbi:hypothetical protein [Bdellovibrio svalbardensis]|uniref:Uncharacterized protein n=1 Tax=Bdellovibrio svalbardensis TaxID=2972972 RepID=A0ABT6DPY1_9BACT|nr:hypothetical protein [Bdellovibrio svalbardensis]MDG0817984.1 hypothetical protein [Bdellovibrio svalbardensis]
MKKLLLPGFFLSLTTLFVCSQAFALADIEITGEADLNASIYSLPTADRGESVFSIPSLLLDFNVPLKEGNLLFVSFEGAEKRDDQSKPFTVQTREAYLDLVSIFEGMHGLRLGLIPTSWQEAQYQEWDYRFLGPTGWVITEKWKYLYYSDLGVSFMSELPVDMGEWALSVVNGQGRDTAEPQPHKESALFLRFTKWNPWTFTANYSRGTYDKYDASVNLRERIQASALFKTEDDHWRVGLEFLDTHDPADAITNLKMAEGVDVTSLTGQAVHGQGGSLFGIVSTGPKAEVMLRWDYLNAVVGASGKELNTWLTSLAYQVTSDVKAAFAADYTKYGENYGKGIRDNSKIEIAAQVLF